MKSLVTKIAFLTTLGLSALSVSACNSSDDATDTVNGKTISDLDIGSDITLDKGATKQATATVKYADGTSTDVTSSADILWNIDDTDVATISKTGLVTGIGTGATKIKATYQGRTSADHALLVH